MKALLHLCLLTLLTMSSLAADGPVYHVVHFKFKAAATATDITKVEAAFAALKGKIPAVETLVWGTNISKEGFDKGLTHCWILTFKDEAARDSYLVHAEHKKFVELLLPLLEEPVVVDFIPKK